MGARVRTSLISLGLLAIGLALVVMGTCFILYKTVELGFTTHILRIPYYLFDVQMPGNYTRARSYSIELAAIRRDTWQPASWVYNTSLPWRNCSGGLYIGTAFIARHSVSYSGTPKLALEIYGMRDGLVRADRAGRHDD